MSKNFRYENKDKRIKPSKNIAAVINIGSNSVRLKIAQNVGGKTAVLEDLRHPLSLGTDTFSTGKIEPQTVSKLCEIIKNYIKVIEQYKIAGARAIATTALREASNSDYIIDIIKTRTGLSIDILNDVEEKSHIYNEVTRLFGAYKTNITDCLMSYIGTGNLGVAYYDKGSFPFMHNLKLGSLRLSELFEDVLDYGEDFFTIVDEYQYSVIDDLRTLMPHMETSNFVACGSEVLFISEICKAKQEENFMYITKENFLAQYEKIKGKTNDQLIEDYNIPESKADLLFPFVSMCKTLLSLTSADKIIMPLINLTDSILYEELFAKEAALSREIFEETIIKGAQLIAERYCADVNHYQVVTAFSKKIFNKLKKQYGFSKKDSLLLEAATIMHDIGKYINIKNHDDHAYSIISASDISGLNPEDTEFVACIAKFNGRIPSSNTLEYSRLSTKKKQLVSKLSAILGIAEALDRSHTQKFKDFDVTLADNVLTITVSTYKDILLEQWAFTRRVKAFEQIFGIKAVLKRKKVY